MRTLAIGGGHGASATLRAALTYADEVAGVITVADDGGSSGRLARELGVLPMGDIRNCLAALARSSPTVEIFQHRFGAGSLEGHVVGNLIIAAVAQQTGSFMAAVDYAAELLGSRGRVVPPTLDPVRLVAEIDGEPVTGQVAVAQTAGRISYVALDPPRPKAYPEAVGLIESADQIVLGPGSLFTSILPNLLVPDVREAFVRSKARKILVCNLTCPPGETSGFDAAAHVLALFAHLGPDSIDHIVVHTGPPPRTDAKPVEVNEAALRNLGVELHGGDIVPADASARHEPVKLAEVLRVL